MPESDSAVPTGAVMVVSNCPVLEPAAIGPTVAVDVANEILAGSNTVKLSVSQKVSPPLSVKVTLTLEAPTVSEPEAERVITPLLALIAQSAAFAPPRL